MSPTRIARALVIVATVFGVPMAQASQEPPPVRLTARAAGSDAAGRTLLVTVDVANISGATIDGVVRLVTAPGVRLLTAPAVWPLRLGRSVHQSRTIAVAIENRGPRELTVEYAPRGDAPTWAALRLFVDGTRLIDLGTLIARQTTVSDGIRWSPLKAHQAPAVREDAPVREVRGRLAYTGYAGEIVPARRFAAELWVSRANGKKDLVATGATGTEGEFVLAVPATADAGARWATRFVMKTSRWIVQGDDGKPYGWESPEIVGLAGAVDVGTLSVPTGQAAQEACWIQTVLNKALDLFERHGLDLSWWTAISMEWPADGDYYSWGTVHLTKAHQWDVVGHEFGHAIYHSGSSSQSAGGQHKIDECYSKTLAFSEGWASFFSAAIQVSRDDEDARFEFMVPRRAPIRVENVPSDVCQGSANEWRVSAALWDLFDTHGDGVDTLAVDFDRMWQAMRNGSRVGSIEKHVDVLKALLSDDEKALVPTILDQNSIR